MSRISRTEGENNYNGEEEIPHNDGFSSLGIDINEPKQSKVILWDYDTMLHHCIYQGYSENVDEFGKKIKNPEFEEKDIEYLQGKLTEMTLKVLNLLEEKFSILALYIWVKGKGNFRKDLSADYKALRPKPNPIINNLYEYAKIAHQTIPADGHEAEDGIFTMSTKIDHNGIILGVDSDLLQIPGLHFNYQKNTWRKISPTEALHLKYKKYCLSDVGDGVKTTPGIGIKYFEKNFVMGMSIEEYEHQLWLAHLKAWKNDEVKAKEQMELGRQLLSLKLIE